MKKIKFGKEALFLTVFSLLTVLTWVGFEIWRSASQTTIPKVSREQVLPLNANLTKNIFEKLGQNLSFTQEELDNSYNNAVTQIDLNESESQASSSAENQGNEEANEEIDQQEESQATDSSQTASESAIVE